MSFWQMPESMLGERSAVSVAPLFEMDTGIRQYDGGV
jgi:hypothetical protein